MQFIATHFQKDTPPGYSPYTDRVPAVQVEELASFVLAGMTPDLIDFFFNDLQADYQKYISRCELSPPGIPPDPIEKSQANKATATAKPSLLNVGVWIAAAVGTLRKWWQGNADKPAKPARPVAQQAAVLNSEAAFSSPTPTAATENPRNFQVNTCEPFLGYDTEGLWCSTSGSEVTVYPKANADGSAPRYLPDTSHAHVNPSDFRTIIAGDTYSVSSCRPLGDSAVYCEGGTTSLIYSPKQPYRDVANSSHIGASVCLLATTGKLLATLGHWVRDRVTGCRSTEDEAAEEMEQAELAAQRNLLKLVKEFQKQYPPYHKHAYIQAFKQLQQLVLDPDKDIDVQLTEHFKKILRGEFSKCKRQDKRETEGMAILLCLARLHVEPNGTEVFNLLPPKIQDYLHDYASDAHQYFKKELGIVISPVKPKSTMEDECIKYSTDAEKRTYQRLIKLPPQAVTQLCQFGFVMQNTPVPRQLLASVTAPALPVLSR